MSAAHDRHRLVQDLFRQVCALEQEERQAFLDEQAAASPEVVEEVRQLLDFDEQDSPLDTPLGGEAYRLADLHQEDAPSPSAVELPEFIGPYRVLGRLAEGGMGAVFRAVQPELKREVALKVLRPGLSSSRLLRRFQLESQILGRLRHPGIAQVFEAGGEEQLGGQAWFAMELIDGVPLMEFVRGRALDREQRLELFLAICEAVEHAHAQGVVHRDLKPANILVQADGAPKVLDFGVARVDDPELAMTTVETSPGHLIGTITHMAPEQLQGPAAEVDARSDVYSLGVLLFELLCDAPPYQLKGLSIAAAAQQLQAGQLRRPKECGIKLPRELEAVLDKALELEPERRYTSAGGLAADLRAFRDGRPMVATPISRSRRLLRWGRRHPVLFSGASAAALVLMVLGAGFGVIRWAGAQPGAVYRDSQGLVTLHSVAGNALHRWKFEEREYVRGTFLLDRPAELGGGQVIVMGFGKEVDDPTLSGQVCFFDPKEPKAEPYWTTAGLSLVPPVEDPDKHPEVEVNLGPVWVDDYFPESPGEEIAFFQQLDPYSPTCLRIIDTAGQVLFEVWHNGALARVHFLPERGRLLAAALNSEANWESRGHPGKDTLYPLVAIAFDLELGHIRGDRWIAEDGEILDPTVAWYRWFGPMEQLASLDKGGCGIHGPQGEWKHTGAMTLVATYRCVELAPTYLLSVFLAIDEEGEILGRWGDEPYTNAVAKGLVPPVEVFRLLDYAELPPEQE